MKIFPNYLQINSMSLRVAVIVLLFAVLEGRLFSDPDEKMEPVDLNYRCFHLQENEQTSKSPILLIHGMGLSLQDWNNVTGVLALGTGRRVCAVDLRNHGDSPHVDHFDVAVMTKDIDHFLDKEGIQNVNIIGHSLGGKIGIHYALNNPKRVDSLVAEDIPPNKVYEKNSTEPGTSLQYFSVLRDAIKSVPDGASEEEAFRFIFNILQKKIVELDLKLKFEEWQIKMFHPIRQVGGKWQYKLNIDAVIKALENFEEFFTKSSGVYLGPTLFIYGTESPNDVGGKEEQIKELFPNAKLIPVQGAGHLVHAQYGKEFTDEVIKMINGIH